MKKRSPAAVIAAVLSVLLLALALFLFWRAAHPVVIVPEESPAVSLPEPEPVTPSAEESPAAEPQEEPDDGLPTDQFFITEARKSYADGGMQLIIPKLDVDVPVLNGVDKETLRRGVGLYDYAQLPSETRSNTSIAGHRNQIWKGQITMDQPFSYIDLLGGRLSLPPGQYAHLSIRL